MYPASGAPISKQLAMRVLILPSSVAGSSSGKPDGKTALTVQKLPIEHSPATRKLWMVTQSNPLNHLIGQEHGGIR